MPLLGAHILAVLSNISANPPDSRISSHHEAVSRESENGRAESLTRGRYSRVSCTSALSRTARRTSGWGSRPLSAKYGSIPAQSRFEQGSTVAMPFAMTTEAHIATDDAIQSRQIIFAHPRMSMTVVSCRYQEQGRQIKCWSASMTTAASKSAYGRNLLRTRHGHFYLLVPFATVASFASGKSILCCAWIRSRSSAAATSRLRTNSRQCYTVVMPRSGASTCIVRCQPAHRIWSMRSADSSIKDPPVKR
jgi:hypothetical protein